MITYKKRALSFVILAVLMLIAVPSFASAASPFKDVKTTHPAYSSIEWAYKKGLIKGYSNGTFKPDATLTEAQFVALLVRFDCSSGNSSDNYRYMQSKNIPLNGYTNMKVRSKPITKGQVARVFAAFRGSDLSETNAVSYMYANDLATGATGKNDYKDYGANLSMTRADAAEFFKRLAKYGDCYMVGLNKKASGSDDTKGYIPPNFTGNETVFFPKPEKNPKPPVATKPSDSQLVAFDIEKSSLIANGVDSTFVTVSLKTCSGQPISYEDSLSFSVTSTAGAKIDNGKFGTSIFAPKLNLEEAEKRVAAAQANAVQAWQAVKNAEEMKLSFETDVVILEMLVEKAVQAAEVADAEVEVALANLSKVRASINSNPIALQSTSSSANSDGPDLIVKITAPPVTVAQKDTLSFQINGKNNPNMDCYHKPVSVQLDYIPQAELRIETEKVFDNQGVASNRVTSKIVRPGGELIQNFTGRVRFHSSVGAYLSNEYAYFVNGVASTTTTRSIWNTEPILDEISAEIDQVDPRYKDEITSVLNKKHSKEMLYDVPLRSDFSCSNNAEVAFIIDSSGSMKKNDRYRERVTKTEQFLDALGSSDSLASDFNSRGRLLSGVNPAYDVRRTIYRVGESGGTNIADGMKVAFGAFTNTKPKVAILLTDGNSNENKILKMLDEAHAQGITIHTIGLGSEKNLNEVLLKKLANETGGQYYHVAESIDLGAAYQSILSEVTCGIPAPSCTTASQLFRSPVLERTSSTFFMSTFVNERCGNVARVVLRFNSLQGDIDYELIPRGQGLFALTKEINEISNFDLYREGVFIAFDSYGNELPGHRYVKMEIRK